MQNLQQGLRVACLAACSRYRSCLCEVLHCASVALIVHILMRMPFYKTRCGFACIYQELLLLCWKERQGKQRSFQGCTGIFHVSSCHAAGNMRNQACDGPIYCWPCPRQPPKEGQRATLALRLEFALMSVLMSGSNNCIT